MRPLILNREMIHAGQPFDPGSVEPDFSRIVSTRISPQIFQFDPAPGRLVRRRHGGTDNDEFGRRAIHDRKHGGGHFGIDPRAAPVDGNTKLEGFLAEGLRATPRAPPRSVADRQDDRVSFPERIIQNVHRHTQSPGPDIPLPFEPGSQRSRSVRRHGSVCRVGRVIELGGCPIAHVTPRKLDHAAVVDPVAARVIDDPPRARLTRNNWACRVNFRPPISLPDQIF